MSEQAQLFRPVVVIPVYNHPQTVQPVVNAIRKLQLPVIIVDDASDTQTHQACELCSCENVSVIHRKTNGGKGAALMTGIQHALSSSYTHIVTVDADGQMDPDSIPRLLRLAQRNPATVICGYSTDRVAYRGMRRVIRRCSTALANLNALSLSVTDVHCGFRVYPLAPLAQLLARIKPGRHMQYDAEILIRLIWLGVRFRNVPIELQMPHDNISHYAHFSDTAALMWMHSRLFVTMLTRLPLIMFARWTGWYNIPHPPAQKPTAAMRQNGMR